MPAGVSLTLCHYFITKSFKSFEMFYQYITCNHVSCLMKIPPDRQLREEYRALSHGPCSLIPQPDCRKRMRNLSEAVMKHIFHSCYSAFGSFPLSQNSNSNCIAEMAECFAEFPPRTALPNLALHDQPQKMRSHFLALLSRTMVAGSGRPLLDHYIQEWPYSNQQVYASINCRLENS